MKSLSLSEAKMKLSALVNDVSTSGREVLITRNGRAAAVLVNPEEFEGWQETMAIRCDPEFMEDIQRGLRELKTKKAKLYSLDELFEDE